MASIIDLFPDVDSMHVETVVEVAGGKIAEILFAAADLGSKEVDMVSNTPSIASCYHHQRYFLGLKITIKGICLQQLILVQRKWTWYLTLLQLLPATTINVFEMVSFYVFGEVGVKVHKRIRIRVAVVDVVLYEKENYLGGHAKTVTMDDGVDLDLGYMVFNRVTYPNMVELFETLGVDIEHSDMSFLVTLDEGDGCEWGSRNGLSSLFAQKATP
ncbi:hypothetical protein CTI12_AA491160 [Artemisia annua]|uniref:Amine oxidase domain-containing protein n=1 Tax=Artemisia annua TaxID=35608 RepID=A0A2U1LHF4_ARTAN|nr:hypothetical protein CTI12_AA491160 [Artemisia annua]